ncbi:MAG: response regulator transcription factor [Methylococcaceae bacterium]|jgi:CheY-like chemotaxis protein/DNA-binding CsgD family transcriptional regulator
MTNQAHCYNGIIMIVDDTPGNLALLSDTLSEANYRVLVATDGLSALEQIQYLKPDIILLDVIMPGIDGFETCSRLKADPDTAQIPVLFMTGLSELDDLLRGFGEGALDYIVKPIRPAEVLARIEVHLSQSRNLLRIESALNHSEFSALSVDSSGRVIWLTPRAKQWFLELNNLPTDVGQLLPEPTLNWAKQCLAAFHCNSQVVDEFKTSTGFNAKMMPSHQSDEYLLLLQKDSPQWNLESLYTSLRLTFREAEILMWISRGKTNKEVGMILGSSPRTVNKHLEHIFEKLGVTTRAAAVAIALQNNKH